MNKGELRRSLLKTRQSLSTAEWREKSDQLCYHLQASTLFQQATTILAYFSVRNEPDLSPLLTCNKTWGFPRCVGRSLTWHAWSSTGSLPLQPGAYGIPEPDPNSPVVSPDAVDLILIPAVGCDRRGYRLGYGGGFYDRLLSSPEWATKRTIGMIFAFAYLPELPIDAWDQSLHGVCTEAGLSLL